MYSMPRDRANHQLEQLLASRFDTPLSTTQQHVAWENAALRVECNLVRNVNTLEDRLAVRIVPTATARYDAVVIPLGDDARFHLVGRYRYPVNRWSIELPRFELDSGDSGWRGLAESELLRLTGLRAARMTLLGAIEIDPALLATSAVVILAEGCALAAPAVVPTATATSTTAGHTCEASPLDQSDDLVAGAMTANLAELSWLVRQGHVSCGVTLAALAHYQAARSGRSSN